MDHTKKLKIIKTHIFPIFVGSVGGIFSETNFNRTYKYNIHLNEF